MSRLLTKLSAIAVLASLTIATPAFADDQDVSAVQKDNAVLSKDDLALAKDRADKARDKANGNWAGQAVDSLSIGADHVLRTEKQAETSADEKVLNRDSSGQ